MFKCIIYYIIIIYRPEVHVIVYYRQPKWLITLWFNYYIIMLYLILLFKSFIFSIQLYPAIYRPTCILCIILDQQLLPPCGEISKHPVVSLKWICLQPTWMIDSFTPTKKKEEERNTHINCSENGVGTETTSMDNMV